ncbi:hypothetical protein HPB52_001225 [Rhipicephalus sanguineus]|uniref:Uncharacterized protein n=1 Tax=Rhipicephalus sanguineus TaxID=34632 RepID=A0A9D4PY79_RHISA|nr:hypothetical protein HPB52_001225 [Rhipicephalus sanguineus]
MLFASKHRLLRASVHLNNFSKHRIPVLGDFRTDLQHQGKRVFVTFYMTAHGTSLLGLDAIQQLGLLIDGATLTCRLATPVSSQLPVGVPPGFEHLPGRVKRRQHIVPVPTKLRRLPLALRQQDASELRRLPPGRRRRRPRSRLHINNQMLPAQTIRDGPAVQCHSAPAETQPQISAAQDYSGQERHKQRGSKRLPRPLIHQSDIDQEEELIDLQLSTVNTKQTAKQYHVKDGLMIGSKQAEKILGHKKPSLVVKDMAQAIWGREGLAERSYGGKLAPKDYKNPNAVVRKQLSPHKVALIIAAFWDAVAIFWGTAAANLSSTPFRVADPKAPATSLASRLSDQLLVTV